MVDTTCILALYMITQTMTHVLKPLAPLYSAVIVIYRRFCRVPRCFHKYSVTCQHLNTCAHLNPPHTPRPPHTVLPRFRRPIVPELVASQRKRVRRAPRGRVLTEKDSSAAPASTRVRGCTQSHGQSCGACLERFFEPLTGAAAPAWDLLRRQRCPKWTCCTNAAACVQACESESAHAPTCTGRKLTRVTRERARLLRPARTHPAPRPAGQRLEPLLDDPRAPGVPIAHRAACRPPE